MTEVKITIVLCKFIIGIDIHTDVDATRQFCLLRKKTKTVLQRIIQNA